MTEDRPSHRHAARIARITQIALVLLAGLAGASLWAHGAPAPASRGSIDPHSRPAGLGTPSAQ